MAVLLKRSVSWIVSFSGRSSRARRVCPWTHQLVWMGIRGSGSPVVFPGFVGYARLHVVEIESLQTGGNGVTARRQWTASCFVLPSVSFLMFPHWTTCSVDWLSVEIQRESSWWRYLWGSQTQDNRYIIDEEVFFSKNINGIRKKLTLITLSPHKD